MESNIIAGTLIWAIKKTKPRIMETRVGDIRVFIFAELSLIRIKNQKR